MLNWFLCTIMHRPYERLHTRTLFSLLCGCHSLNISGVIWREGGPGHRLSFQQRFRPPPQPVLHQLQGAGLGGGRHRAPHIRPPPGLGGRHQGLFF